MADLNGLNLNMRTNPDLWAKSIRYFVAASWILGSVTLILTFLTIPALKVFLNTYLHLKLSPQPNPTFYKIDFILTALTFLVSLVGILVSSTRNRRRRDRINGSLVFIGIVSFIGSVILLVLNT
jgi:hypothetical protein